MSPTVFAVAPVAALAAGAALLAVGSGALDRWLAPRPPPVDPVEGLVRLMASSPPGDRAGVLTADQEHTLAWLGEAPSVAAVDPLLPAAGGAFRAELLVRKARGAEAAGDAALGLECRMLARSLVPTDLRLLADLAAAHARRGDAAAVAACAREWRQLGGVVPPALAKSVDAWLAAVG